MSWKGKYFGPVDVPVGQSASQNNEASLGTWLDFGFLGERRDWLIIAEQIKHAPPRDLTADLPTEHGPWPNSLA
jgi:hypothetical protein